jgi:CheY-like chemotaxis protein
MKAVRILLGDDQDAILRAMNRVLRSSGVELFVEKHPENAVARVEELAIEAVVSDFTMPGIPVSRSSPSCAGAGRSSCTC